VKGIMPPFRSTRPLLVLLAASLLGAQPLSAQQSKDPHIGYVFPAGGQRGTAFEVVVGGQFLDATTNVVVSGGDGVRATVVKINKPFPQKRFNELRDYLEQARKKLAEANTQPAPQPNTPPVPQPNTQPVPQPNTPPAPQPNTQPVPQPNTPPAPQPNTQPAPQPNTLAASQPNTQPAPAKSNFLGPAKAALVLKEAGATDDEIKEFFERVKQFKDPKRQQNQQLNETVTLRVEIAADAPTGPREIRLLKPAGVSNPLSFCVGQLPEQVNASSGDQTPGTPTPVTLPVIVNGQILPGGLDHFSFHAARGAHLVIAAQGRDLIPYLADAVPGWFQPALSLVDEKGKEVAFADHFYFNTDPVIYYDVPQDGTYRLEVRDLLFRGREDFVYRIMIGEVRFVRDIFPLGGPPGVATAVTVSGWNLPSTKIKFTPPGPEGVYPVAELSNGFVTRNILFAGDTLPECMAAKPNSTPQQAQRVVPPMVINGRIGHPGDVDVFAVSCRAGEHIVAEVCARRLNSPLDSWLRVTDATGKQLAFNDDHEDKGAGLLTQGADSYLTFSAPTEGLYYLHLGDAQGKGGPEYAYRLRISEPRPDFALYITPSGINGHAGASVPVTVQAVRRDGFSGDIFLAFKDASTGFALDGGKIPAGQDKVRATITFPQTTAGSPLFLALEGHAAIAGHDVIRPVQPADDMIQAFMYHHLVPARELVAMAPASTYVRPPITIADPGPMKLTAGGSAQAVVSLKGRAPFVIADTRLQLSDAPDGISIGDISPTTNGAAISFKADAAKVKPGLKGNLIVETFTEKTPPPVDGKPSEKKRWSNGFLPAIPFEVVGVK